MQASLLFDLDETLLDFRRAEREAIFRVLTALELPATDETAALYSRCNAEQWRLLEKGLVTRDEALTNRFSTLFAALGVARDAAYARRLYEPLLAEGAYLLPGARELLETLYTDYALYIVSNGTATVQDRRIEKTGIARYFRGVFISEHIGCNKPDARFFTRVADHIPGFDPTRAVVIGDSLSSDILGAKNAGLPSIWLNAKDQRDPDPRPDYEVRTLAEIPPLLARLFPE